MAPSNTGYHYSHPEPGEEVFITGIAGYFPKSNSVAEFQENLFNKLDLITNVSELWKIRDVETPPKVGKINKHNRFDAKFFGMDYKTAHHTDPMSRLLLERTYEALIDAGVNPAELRNTMTGVYVVSCFVDTEKALMCNRMQTNDYGIPGCARSNLAARLAEWLEVRGPTYNLDTACSSSMYALDHAYRSIRDGRCDSAIVGAVNLSVNYQVFQLFAGVGLAAPDGKCKCFDESANGYVRAESIAVCFLQKSKDARRVHAQLVHVKTNCDGFKEQNILFPSAVIQERLLQEFYEECDVLPEQLEYMECHSTGTRAGDREEMIAVDEVLCKKRLKPLLVGTVKSNMGHSEPASGLCSLIKVCIAYNTGFIPPNINIWNLRKDITAIKEGRAQVVTEKQQWNRGCAAISNFGFGGANSHCLLKNGGNTKVNNGLPRDGLPRLVCVSGRTLSAVERILRDLETRSVDVEEIRLWHAIHEKDIAEHNYRGYTILRSVCGRTIPVSQVIEKVVDTRRQICFMYTYIDKQSMNMFSLYMEIPPFAAAIQRCHKVLTIKGLDLLKLCTDYDEIKEKHLDLIITVAIQIAITDTLKKTAVKPDYVIGEALGELCCAYADGCFTDEQTILAAYDITVLQKESKLKQNNSLNTVNGHEKIDETISNNKNISNLSNDCLFFGTAEKVRQYLQKHIPYRQRSKRWCYTESPRKPEENNNYNSQLLRRETNTVLIGVTSQVNLGNITKRKEITYIPLFQESTDNIVHFLETWSRLFMNGLNPHLAHLYPSVQFPVSQGTPMLSHLVEWDHRENWYVDFESQDNGIIFERKVLISLNNHTTEYLKGHNIDGRVLYPGTGYLVLVWETLALTMSTTCDNLSVVFEDVRLERATIIPEHGSVELVIMMQKVTGEFEITENDVTLAKGRIFAKQNVGHRFKDLPDTDMISNDESRMKTKDFYKEMMLRGYGHSGLFQGILDCDVKGTHSRIAWVNNWVVFLDNLFQTCIISDNKTRNLSVPTRLEKLSIDTNLHFSNIKYGPPYYIDVFNNAVVNLIRSAGVEIRGLYFNRIGRTISHCNPTIESYEFVSYFGEKDMQPNEVLEVYIQIIVENMNISLFKSIEFIQSKNNNKFDESITKIIDEAIENVPDVETHLNIVTDESLQLPAHINVLSESADLQDNASLIIGADLLTNMKTIQQYQSYLLNGGFIISREKIQPDLTTKRRLVDIISIQNVGKEYLVLLRNKITNDSKMCIKIEMADSEFLWLDQVKKEISHRKVILYAQNEYTNGIIGLINCLRKEPDGANVCAFLITDPAAPPFDPDLEFYKQEIYKNLRTNVFQEGQWGSYRHVPLKQTQKLKKVSHAYNHIDTVGDISTLQWIEGPLNEDTSNNVIHVYYSAMNFRDVMVATGRMHVNDEEEIGINKANPNLGLEAVGRTANGSRVICLTHRGFSNKVLSDYNVLIPIPDEWTFEEAATVIMVYSTVYVGLIIMGKMRAGESVLIHAGAGGVGQAAINVALHYGCEVFTTVGSPEKRALVKKLFPQLKDSHIGSSRDTSFEELIRKETNGRGVDIVLNSLADDMLQASVRCLAYRGRFLEIGKYDIYKNTLFNLDFYEHEISLYSVMLDKLEIYTDQFKQELLELLLTGIVSGSMRPLTSCTFDKDDIESAYRYMASGKHIGKVLIKIRDEEKQQHNPVKPTPFYMDAVPRYTFNTDNVFIIIGGMGGFGLELTHWLIKKSASKILLVSSRGITNGYQKYRIRVWKSLGVNVQVCTQDATTESGCEDILNLANSMGTVEGIFNLAAILKDSLFQEQSQESYKIVYKPKAIIARNFDKLSRKLCPQLKDFVMFSSLSCGHGNAGQTNYGLANSVMDRICEKRKKEGLPALSIQWGLIGDVGLVAEMSSNNPNITINGLSIQSINSCLQTLDTVMRQDAAIVCSCVIVSRNNTLSNKMSLVETIAKIKGIRDMQTISHQATLNELGMDSMMAVEIKQALERDFKIFLTPQEIRKLTFARLAELSTENDIKDSKNQESNMKPRTTFKTSAILKNICDEETASEPFLYMPSIYDEKTDKNLSTGVLFMVPGFEGFATVFEELCKKLHIKTCVLQLGVYNYSETFDQTTERMFKVLIKLLPPGQPFKLLGYSFGVNIMLSLAAKLEMQGHSGTVFCLDGSPTYLQRIALRSYKEDKDLRNDIIYSLLIMANVDTVDVEPSDDNENIESAVDRVLEKYYTIPNKFSKGFMKSLALSVYNRHWMIRKYKPEDFNRIKSPIILLRAKEQVVPFDKDDYNLYDRQIDNSVTVHSVIGNHADMVNNCAEILNEYLVQPHNNV